MLFTIALSLILLFLVIAAVLIVRRNNCVACDYETYEEEVIVTEFPKQNWNPNNYPALRVYYDVDMGMYYVFDPETTQRVLVYPDDDMYEDELGNIWRLV
jgi:hypothetical protein